MSTAASSLVCGLPCFLFILDSGLLAFVSICVVSPNLGFLGVPPLPLCLSILSHARAKSGEGTRLRIIL